jgi:ABC-type lipoprotein release transport system permease subunit
LVAIGAGVALAASAMFGVGRWLERARSFPLGGFEVDAPTLAVIALALGVATLAVAWPAWRAARIDLHRTLARG